MAAPADTASTANAEESLWSLVDQITKLAPQLSPASIFAASSQIASLSPRLARPSAAMQAAQDAEEPLVPQDLAGRMDALVYQRRGNGSPELLSASSNGGAEDEAADHSGVGGQPAADLWQPGGTRLEHLDQVGYHASSGGGLAAFERDWPARSRAGGDADEGSDGSSGDGDDDGDDDELEQLVTREEKSEDLGFDPGLSLVCDPCDLAEEGGVGCSCMAVDMLHVSDIKDVIRKWKKKMEKPGALREFPERRAPRYHLYRAVIKWKFADPLGAGNRVCIPECVKRSVRKLFPSPCCGAGCDYGSACEAKGHYIGHLTVAESRVRNGESLDGESHSYMD